MSPEQLARLFHETYERLAPAFGYETRKASSVPWKEVPEPNRSLMVAVAAEVLKALQQSEAALLEELRLREETQIPMIPRGAKAKMDRLEARTGQATGGAEASKRSASHRARTGR